MKVEDSIAKILNDFEIRLIAYDFGEYCVDVKKELENLIAPELCEALNHVLQCISKSDFGAALHLNLSTCGFSSSAFNIENAEDFMSDILKDENDVARHIKEIILMCIGISCLQEFIRNNFCGPRHKIEQYSVVSTFIPDHYLLDSKVFSLLSLDGESVHPSVIQPELLFLSIFLLTHVKIPSSFTQNWWLLRSKFIHQSLLPERNEFLHSTLVSLITDVCQMEWINEEKNVTKKLIFFGECCQIFLYYGEVVQARKYIKDSQIITGLEIELSGAMGKRTQYQQKALPQLFVKLKRNHLDFTGTMPDAVDDRSVPGAEDDRSVPDAEDDRSVPGAEDDRSVPGAGNDKSIPDAGDERSMPDAGDERSMPDAGDERSMTDAGDERSMTDAVEDRSVTDAKDDRSVPDAGDERSVTDAKDDRSVPDAGDERSVPDAGDDRSVPDAGNDSTFPADQPLDDDVLLNKVAFIDDNEYALKLFAEEQILLLGYCCLAQRNGSSNELLQEELMSYITCLLSQPRIWSVYIKCLIMRCKIEKTSSRRVERAVKQMEAIVESVKKISPPLNERLKFFHCTSFPPYWVLEKDLADLLFSLSCNECALEVYERLELWEDVVKCLIRLNRASTAEKVIQKQLEKEETPMMWCLLGDVTENTDHYLRAWELSNRRSARAQRSLGYYYFKRKEYEKSLPHFVSSLDINHLQPEVWFSAGHAATQAENFELAVRAYRQVVMFDEDNFEAWNNLANAYIKTKQKVMAWRCLQEALKCNYEEWRVWENFLLVSTDLGAFEDALRAWHRLLDIKGKHSDALLLEILVNAIIKDLPDINGFLSSRLKSKALELLERITSLTSNEPKVWELYAALANSNSDESAKLDILEKVVLYQQKAISSYLKKASWENHFNVCKEALSCALKLAEISLDYISILDGDIKNQQIESTKLSLRNIIKRATKNLDNFPLDQNSELSDILKFLQNMLNGIINL